MRRRRHLHKRPARGNGDDDDPDRPLFSPPAGPGEGGDSGGDVGGDDGADKGEVGADAGTSYEGSSSDSEISLPPLEGAHEETTAFDAESESEERGAGVGEEAAKTRAG